MVMRSAVIAGAIFAAFAAGASCGSRSSLEGDWVDGSSVGGFGQGGTVAGPGTGGLGQGGVSTSGTGGTFGLGGTTGIDASAGRGGSGGSPGVGGTIATGAGGIGTGFGGTVMTGSGGTTRGGGGGSFGAGGSVGVGIGGTFGAGGFIGVGGATGMGGTVSIGILPILPGVTPTPRCVACVNMSCGGTEGCASNPVCVKGLVCSLASCGVPSGMSNVGCLLGCFGGDVQAAATAITDVFCVYSTCGQPCTGGMAF